MKKFLACALALVVFICQGTVCLAMKRSSYVDFGGASQEQNSHSDDSGDENQFEDTFLFSTPLNDDYFCPVGNEDYMNMHDMIEENWGNLEAFGYFSEENVLTDDISESSDLSEENFASVKYNFERQIDTSSENSANLGYQFTFHINGSFDDEVFEHPFDWQRYSSPYIEELK